MRNLMKFQNNIQQFFSLGALVCTDRSASGHSLCKTCSAKRTIRVQVDFQSTSTFGATLAPHCVCMWVFHYICTIAPEQMQGGVKYFMKACMGACLGACSVSVPCKYAVNSPSGI